MSCVLRRCRSVPRRYFCFSLPDMIFTVWFLEIRCLVSRYSNVYFSARHYFHSIDSRNVRTQITLVRKIKLCNTLFKCALRDTISDVLLGVLFFVCRYNVTIWLCLFICFQYFSLEKAIFCVVIIIIDIATLTRMPLSLEPCNVSVFILDILACSATM